MKKLTAEEAKAHQKTIKGFRERIARVKYNYADGDITKKKMESKVREIKAEEESYIENSGVILYYGQLFKATK